VKSCCLRVREATTGSSRASQQPADFRIWPPAAEAPRRPNGSTSCQRDQGFRRLRSRLERFRTSSHCRIDSISASLSTAEPPPESFRANAFARKPNRPPHVAGRRAAHSPSSGWCGLATRVRAARRVREFRF
jgi:hypothetical protein